MAAIEAWRTTGSGPGLAALLALMIGYALGSIPFGLILTRIGGGGDLRQVGSGNIGATNVLRTGRKGLAAATLLLDAGKGVAAVIVARTIMPDAAALGAVGAVLGHCYPVWLRFRGGKGVATLLGVASALSPPCGLAFVGVWLAALAVTRYSSVAGMLAAATLPVTAALASHFELAILFLLLSLLIMWKHRTNLERLLDGSEPRVGNRG